MGQFSLGSQGRRDIMLRYTAVIVLLLSFGVNAQRRGGRVQSFRQGRDGSAGGDYSAPVLPLSNEVASYGGAASDTANDPLAALSASIPGIPGEDYPIYTEVPESGFACDGQVDGGYYADPEAEWQVFHICTADGAGGLAKYSFLCPNGTIFNQNYFICDWWFNFDCSSAEDLYSLNDEIAAEREAIDGAASDPAGSYVSPDSQPIGGYNAPDDVVDDAQAAYGQAARNARNGRGPQQPFSQRSFRNSGGQRSGRKG